MNLYNKLIPVKSNWRNSYHINIPSNVSKSGLLLFEFVNTLQKYRIIEEKYDRLRFNRTIVHIFPLIFSPIYTYILYSNNMMYLDNPLNILSYIMLIVLWCLSISRILKHMPNMYNTVSERWSEFTPFK